MASPLFQLQSPWLPISWKGAAPDQPLRFVLVARRTEDAVPLTLAELPGSAGRRSFLAAQVDSQNNVFDWFEVQVQTSQGLTQSPAALCGFLNNAILDADWNRSLNEDTVERVVFAGDELGDPWAIDPQNLSVTRLLHRKTKAPLRLCRDDDVLVKAAKPAYGESLQRWFKSETPSGKIHWVELSSVSDDARNELILESGGSDPFIDFNVSAGKILIRRYDLLSLQTAIDLLRQQYGLKAPEESMAQSAEDNLPTLLAQEVAGYLDKPNPEKLPSVSSSPAALEKLYHLLVLWKEAVQAVTESSRVAQRPFLNLDANSFRIRAGTQGNVTLRGQPNRVELVRKADAIPFEVEPGNLQFVPCGAEEKGRSLERFGGWQVGTGTARFSQVSEASAGVTRVEGFLDGQLLRDPSDATLVWVQMTLDGRSISFLARLETGQVGARAGVRFHAALSSLAPESIKALKSTTAPRRACQFSVLQPVSPTQDIYHLGQLGIRILMTNTEDGILEVEDDIFELASLIPRSSGIEQLKVLGQTPDLNERLRGLLSSGKWFPDVASNSIPVDLWLAVLHELMEFVAVEEHPAGEQADAQPWIQPLLLRCAAVERLVLHVEGLLWIPRAVDEEIGRIVHRFLPGRG